MAANKFYMPIVKCKYGEFTALSKLSLEGRKHLFPVFELMPVEYDSSLKATPRTLHEHLDLFCERFESKWRRDHCFIDPHLLHRDGIDNTPEVEYVYTKLNSLNFWPIPIVRMDSTKAYILTIEEVISNRYTKEAGLRLSLESVFSQTFETDMKNILKSLDLKVTQTHLILDLAGANFIELTNFCNGLIDLLELFPDFKEWKSFTIAGSAIPKNNDIKKGLSEIKRNDWALYKLLKQSIQNQEWYREIQYGDYGIVHPEYIAFDVIKMSPGALVKYTHKEKWIVAKGQSLKKAGREQFKALARSIYDTPDYGEGFSEGSNFIAKCVRGEVKKFRAPGIWVWVGTNQHFQRVLFDLFSILP